MGNHKRRISILLLTPTFKINTARQRRAVVAVMAGCCAWVLGGERLLRFDLALLTGNDPHPAHERGMDINITGPLWLICQYPVHHVTVPLNMEGFPVDRFTDEDFNLAVRQPDGRFDNIVEDQVLHTDRKFFDILDQPPVDKLRFCWPGGIFRVRRETDTMTDAYF